MPYNNETLYKRKKPKQDAKYSIIVLVEPIGLLRIHSAYLDNASESTTVQCQNPPLKERFSSSGAGWVGDVTTT